MKANELRIGNWVMGNAPFQVNAGNILTHYNQFKLNGKDRFEPIPLTEEWLLNFGFEFKGVNIRKGNGTDYQPSYPRTHQKDYVLNNFVFRFEEFHYKEGKRIYIDKDTYIIVTCDGNYYPFIYENIVYCEKIKYVHQLQNLYSALTNKELKLK